ncbi:MAG: hypothetical protein IKR19_08390 [Acholeplasmatales bacterium]|nr:hypothetical protein [Acholeplasmatales bacterium]
MKRDEAELKTNIVAILEDLLMEIEGLKVNTTIVQTEFSGNGPARFYNKGICAATTKIQQKINSLKE